MILIIISPNRSKAEEDFRVARELLEELGLPEALDKAQSPSHKAVWLGVKVNARDMTPSLPGEKLQEVKVSLEKADKCRTISKKQLQSLLGKLLHVGKCVRPARLFVSRLLEALDLCTETSSKYLIT